VVASMGGIAGSQTLTLVIRGLALGQVDTGNLRVLLGKELGIGTLNGVLWALLVATVAIIWFGDLGIGWVIGLAILINLVCAVLAGLLIPLILRRFGIDPALAGSMVLMAVTDVVGFSSFLGLATLFLIWVTARLAQGPLSLVADAGPCCRYTAAPSPSRLPPGEISMNLPTVRLKSNCDRRLRAGHLWVFS